MLIRLLVVFASVVLSYLTWRFIEKPLRSHPSPRAVPAALAAAVFAVGAVGLFIHLWRPAPRLDNAELDVIHAAIEDWTYPWKHQAAQGRFEPGVLPGKAPSKVLFVGDSHAQHYYPRVKALADADPDRFPTTIFLAKGGCAPLPGNWVKGGIRCDGFFQYAMELAADPDVRTVVISALWETFFVSRRFHREGDSTPLNRASAPAVLGTLGDSIKSLRAQGKNVFIILSSPVSKAFDPKQMVSRLTGAIQPLTASRAESTSLSRPIMDELKAVALRSGARVIDPVPFLCGASTCPARAPDGRPLYRDRDHLRPFYAAQAAVFIDQIYQQP